MAKKQPPRQKHVPLRSCIVCRQRYEKRRLTRIVNSPESGVVVDPTGKLNGRGAYLCDQPACWDKVLHHPGILDQALRSQVTEDELAAMAAHRPAATPPSPTS
ncbi:MAG: YlxR family protein [Chloroflexota bacterium]